MSDNDRFVIEHLEAYLAEGSKVVTLTFSDGARAWVLACDGVFDLCAAMPFAEAE